MGFEITSSGAYNNLDKYCYFFSIKDTKNKHDAELGEKE